jgi:hypothetical protein
MGSRETRHKNHIRNALRLYIFHIINVIVLYFNTLLALIYRKAVVKRPLDLGKEAIHTLICNLRIKLFQ